MRPYRKGAFHALPLKKIVYLNVKYSLHSLFIWYVKNFELNVLWPPSLSHDLPSDLTQCYNYHRNKPASKLCGYLGHWLAVFPCHFLSRHSAVSVNSLVIDALTQFFPPLFCFFSRFFAATNIILHRPFIVLFFCYVAWPLVGLLWCIGVIY